MPGFVALLAVFAVCSAGQGSSVSGDRGPGRTGCPGRCRCEVDGLLHRVDCADLGLRDLPSNLSVFTSYLDLSMNNLTQLPSGALSNLHFLEELRLDANHISSVPIGCFSGLRSLRHLWLDDNWLWAVPVEALSELPALQAMTLALNHISHIPDHAFANLSSLVVLDLNYNSLVEFPMAIRSLSHLKELGFHSNSIQSIPEHAFIGNPSLLTIFFYDNPIQSVGRSAFQNLPELRTLSLNGAADITDFPDLTGTKSLESLTITGARITSLPSSVCEQLPNLQLLFRQRRGKKRDLSLSERSDVLVNMNFLQVEMFFGKVTCFPPPPSLPPCSDLSSNQLAALPLINLQSLTHLRLAGNTELMELIPREHLVMELPYAFQCCAFIYDLCVNISITEKHFFSHAADQDWEDFLLEFEDEPKSQHSVQCSPAPGPFRPCLHLLGSWLIRGGVWLIAALSLVSNGLVVLSVFLSPAASVTPPKLLIGLLALVNGLMGVWCGWLAAVDGWTYGEFWRYGARWESSFLCRLSGFLCVFASQTGLFLLTVAALERSLDAVSVFAAVRSSPVVSVRLSVCLCFLLGLAVTLPPLVVGHGTTSLCLPLPSSSSSSSSSLAFSVSLVLLNSLCFLLMTLAYTRLYCRADKASGPPEEEAALTRHVAWLLFSDCLLYLPVAFLSFSSLLRLPVAGPEAAKGVLLLVVPLPACINPLLYLLFTPLAREELAALGKRARQAAAARLGGGGASRDELDLPYDEDEDAEKQSCDSTQALVAMGGMKEEEEEEEEERGRGRERSETQHSVTFVVPCR
uniref:G-protein coupled receptors family 1 profile domain-containing protein n=1 Tax=Myripristis murdjan TaxID=586833 RepID=A0A667XME6_9TELE